MVVQALLVANHLVPPTLCTGYSLRNTYRQQPDWLFQQAAEVECAIRSEDARDPVVLVSLRVLRDSEIYSFFGAWAWLTLSEEASCKGVS